MRDPNGNRRIGTHSVTSFLPSSEVTPLSSILLIHAGWLMGKFTWFVNRCYVHSERGTTGT